MTAQIETTELVDAWLYGVLSGDGTITSLLGATGRIENTVGPITPALTLPKIHFQCVVSRDVTTTDGTIIDTNSLYDVEAIQVGDSFGVVQPLAARIHSLIHRTVYTFVGGGSLTCVRESILQRTEVHEGLVYRHLGGSYRIRCSRD